MSGGSRTWAVRLAAAAESDFQDILRWTAQQFGEAQARDYAETLSSALEALMDGPAVPGVKARDDIARGILTLHVARHGRRGRHFILFRIGHHAGHDVIDVLRLLHDAMDLPRHVPRDDLSE